MAEIRSQVDKKSAELEAANRKFGQLREEAKSRIKDLKSRMEEMATQLEDKDKQIEAKVETPDHPASIGAVCDLGSADRVLRVHKGLENPCI